MYSARNIRGLPYRLINAMLALALQHDTVHISAKVIAHIRARHPHDCELCIASMEIVIAAPDYIGQEPHHPNAFELVKEIAGAMVLVAISVVPDEYGDYPVLSSYVIPHDALQRRIRKGHLRINEKGIR